MCVPYDQVVVSVLLGFAAGMLAAYALFLLGGLIRSLSDD